MKGAHFRVIKNRGRRAMDMKVSGSTGMYKNLFEESPVPMFRAKINGEFIAVNKAFIEILRLPGQDVVSNINTSVFFADNIEREYLSGLLEKEKMVRNMPLHMKRFDDTDFTVLITAHLVRSSAGEQLIEGILVDITPLRQLEEEQKKLQVLQYRSKYMDSISKLAAGMAHDINNILAGIHGHAQVIQHKIKDESIQTSVMRIITGVEKADIILQGLLTSIGSYEYQPFESELGQFVSSVLPQFEKNDLPANSCKIYIMEEPILSVIDPTLMKQVLLELIKNALSAEGGESEVLVTVGKEKPEELICNFLQEPEQKCACISVIDKGRGINLEIADRIFEPYFTTENFGSGAGIGLTKVYGIIQKHDGAIGIKTEKDKGTAFSIYLELKE